jgi:hypothetical protein
VLASVAAQNTVVLLSTRYNAESTGNVLSIPLTYYFPSAPCQSGSAWADGWHWGTNGTDGPTPTCQSSQPTNNVFATMSFDDSATEYIFRQIHLDADWIGAIDLAVLWYSTATTGNVVWQIQTSCVADGESVAPPLTYNAVQTIVDATKGSSSQLNTASLSSLTTTGCSASEWFHLRFFRDPTHASDTLGASAQLVGVRLTLRRAI